MSKERVGYIIGLLGYAKVCSRWVPRMLTQEKKQKHVEIYEELLKRYREEGDQFLLNIVTGNESWIHHFDPEEKRLSMHLLAQKNKKQCRLPARFFCLFFGTHRELT
jgi:histone-lysine N-methyltransferase SETMAR